MEPTRKAFRQVGDTLVQHTIGEVIEILTVHLENVSLKSTEEIGKFQKCRKMSERFWVQIAGNKFFGLKCLKTTFFSRLESQLAF